MLCHSITHDAWLKFWSCYLNYRNLWVFESKVLFQNFCKITNATTFSSNNNSWSCYMQSNSCSCRSLLNFHIGKPRLFNCFSQIVFTNSAAAFLGYLPAITPVSVLCPTSLLYLLNGIARSKLMTDCR